MRTSRRQIIRAMMRTARSRFDDLGDRKECGPDLVLKRAPENMRFEVSDQLRNQTFLTNTLEKKIYPASSDPDFVVSVKHSMKLSDGSPWSGKDTFKIGVRLTSHAQHRMDLRCITSGDVHNMVKHTFLKMEQAWNSKNVSDYNKIFKWFSQGTGGSEKIKAPSNGDNLLYVMAPVNFPNHSDLLKTRRGDIAVKTPSASTVVINIVSVMGGNRSRITKEDLEKAHCKEVLESKGYTLTKKGSSRLAYLPKRFRPSVILTQADGSMLRSNGEGWVGPFNYGLNIEMKMDESEATNALSLGDGDKAKEVAKFLRPELAKMFKERIYDKWDAKNFSAYNDNLRSIYEGFTVEREGIKFVFESDAARDLGTIEDYGQTLLIPHVMSNKPYLYYKVKIESSHGKGLSEVREDKETQKCIDLLSDDYYITKG